ncbi:glutathione S-transferase LANCL1-like [Littorina saxatilis]|uniref:LanC-like protein 2 n=1 Tax=Littorina saxatilis TaxID=31220 RepID=A0AAN9GJA0_9CAEN
MTSRSFPNLFPDYHGEQILAKNERLDDEFSHRVKASMNSLLGQLQAGLQHVKGDNYSVYTGQTGIALLYLHLYHTFPDATDRQSYLEKAVGYLQPALRHLGSGVFTFMCGDAGTLAVAAVAFARLGDSRTSKECLSRLEGLSGEVVKESGTPDEHLYGRAGYLAALMFVQSHLGSNVIHVDTIRKVVRAMLASGQALSHKKKWEPPLMYAWYKEHYMGAAHGLAGIIYTLLLARKDPELCAEIDKVVPATMDYLLKLQFPSGNFPAVIGEKDDRLVHWCHGAPGWTSMLALAYQAYNNHHYLEAAERCGEVTWQRGLLKKGYGLCHGTAGNAYAFLALFRLTQNQKHLYRACKFAEWCFDYGKHGCRVPDTPFSLFEGMAGTVYFLADILNPLKARFPAYEY